MSHKLFSFQCSGLTKVPTFQFNQGNSLYRDVFQSSSPQVSFLSISQTNALKLFSQKSSRVDKTNYSVLHAHIYLERSLQIFLCLTGTPIVFLSFLKEKLPKAKELKDINHFIFHPNSPNSATKRKKIICGKAAQNSIREEHTNS